LGGSIRSRLVPLELYPDDDDQRDPVGGCGDFQYDGMVQSQRRNTLGQYTNLGSENSATYQIFGVFNTNVAGTFTQNEIDLSDSGTSVKSSVTTSGSAVFNPGGTLNGVGVVNREVLSYAAANYAFSLNHGTSTSASTGALPSAAAYAYIGSQPDGNIRDRYIRKILYYAQRLNADYIQPL
jgi:hypothetical protein